MKEIKIEATVILNHPKCNICEADAEILLTTSKAGTIAFCLYCGTKVQTALQKAIDSIPF